jgi:hypothetical protein
VEVLGESLELERSSHGALGRSRRSAPTQ